jgi:predicted nuclease of predicted toxin-antitoxin system
VKILLDENLDWRLGRDLAPHEVKSVPQIGWAGFKNGALLAEAQKQFDVFITMDSAMRHQQNIAKFEIAIIALKSSTNRLADTRPLMPKVLALLPALKAGTLTIVEYSHFRFPDPLGVLVPWRLIFFSYSIFHFP